MTEIAISYLQICVYISLSSKIPVHLHKSLIQDSYFTNLHQNEIHESFVSFSYSFRCITHKTTSRHREVTSPQLFLLYMRLKVRVFSMQMIKRNAAEQQQGPPYVFFLYIYTVLAFTMGILCSKTAGRSHDLLSRATIYPPYHVHAPTP